MSTQQSKRIYLAPATAQISVSYPLRQVEESRKVQTINLDFSLDNPHDTPIEPQTSLLDPKHLMQDQVSNQTRRGTVRIPSSDQLIDYLDNKNQEAYKIQKTEAIFYGSYGMLDTSSQAVPSSKDTNQQYSSKKKPTFQREQQPPQQQSQSMLVVRKLPQKNKNGSIMTATVENFDELSKTTDTKGVRLLKSTKMIEAPKEPKPNSSYYSTQGKIQQFSKNVDLKEDLKRTKINTSLALQEQVIRGTSLQNAPPKIQNLRQDNKAATYQNMSIGGESASLQTPQTLHNSSIISIQHQSKGTVAQSRHNLQTSLGRRQRNSNQTNIKLVESNHQQVPNAPPKSVLDLNQQIIQGDISGIFNQVKPKSTLNRQRTHEKIPVTCYIPPIKVQIESKKSRDSKKRRSSQAPNDDRASEKENLALVENRTVEFRSSGNIGVAPVAVNSQSALDSSIAKDAIKRPRAVSSKKELDSAYQTSSSFNTIAPTSYLRTAKHLGQFIDEDVYSAKSPDRIQENSSKSKEPMLVEVAQQTREFVVYSFKNRLRSKPQREAKRSVSNNPYLALQTGQGRVLSQENSQNTGVQVAESISKSFPVQNQTSQKTNEHNILFRDRNLSSERDADLKLSTQTRSLSLLGDGESDVQQFSLEKCSLVKEEETEQQAKFSYKPNKSIYNSAQKRVENSAERRVEFNSQDEDTTTKRMETTLYMNQTKEKVFSLQNIRSTNAPLSTMPPMLRNLDENIARERQAILKVEFKVKRNLQDTKSFVEQPIKKLDGQNPFSVQNIKLFPRDINLIKSGLTLGNPEDMTHIKQKQNNNQTGNRVMAARKNQRVMSVSYLKRNQKRKAAKKPLGEAKIQLTSELSLANLVRGSRIPDQSQNLRNNKTQRGTVKLSEESLLDFASATSLKLTIKKQPKVQLNNKVKNPNDTFQSSYVDTVTEEAVPSKEQSILHINLNQKEKDYQQMISSHEVIMLQTLKQSELYTDKFFGVRKHSKQKSMIYVRNNAIKHNDPLRGTLNQQKFQQSNSSHEHDSFCNCKPEKNSQSNWLKKNSTDIIQNEIEIDSNPYNLSGMERERLKDKNRDLIAQFHSARDHNVDGKKESPSQMKNLESAKKSVKSISTLYKNNYTNMERLEQGRRSDLVVTQMISNFTATAKQEQEEPPIDDLKKNDISHKATNRPFESINSNEEDISSIILPHKSLLVPSSQKGGQLDELDTAKIQSTSREQVDAIAPVLDKSRPSKLSTERQSVFSQKLNQLKSRVETRKTSLTNVGSRQKSRKKLASIQRSLEIRASSGQPKLDKQSEQMQTAALHSSSIKHNERFQNSHNQLNPKSSQNAMSSQSHQMDEEPFSSQHYHDEKKEQFYQHLAEMQGEQLLDPVKVLSMSENEIGELNFKQICMAQQMLYETLTQLQVELGQVCQGQNQSIKLLPDNRLSTSMTKCSRQRIVQNLYTTNYQGNTESQPPLKSRDIVTPFSTEQQQLRLNWNLQQRAIYGKPQHQKYEDVARQVKVPKIKLIEENIQADGDRKQQEVNNYYKFKRNQERIRRRKDKMEKQSLILSKCSPEKFILLSQINYLMQKQNLLVQKAKQITMREFLDPENRGLENFAERSQQVEKMMEIKEKLERFNVESILEHPIMTSIQQISFRSSNRKISQAYDSKDIIVAAQDKLLKMNRTISAEMRDSSRNKTIRSRKSVEEQRQLSIVAANKSGILETVRENRPTHPNENMIMTDKSYNGLADDPQTKILILPGDGTQDIYQEFGDLSLLAQQDKLRQQKFSGKSFASKINLLLIKKYSQQQKLIQSTELSKRYSQHPLSQVILTDQLKNSRLKTADFLVAQQISHLNSTFEAEELSQSVTRQEQSTDKIALSESPTDPKNRQSSINTKRRPLNSSQFKVVQVSQKQNILGSSSMKALEQRSSKVNSSGKDLSSHRMRSQLRSHVLIKSKAMKNSISGSQRGRTGSYNSDI